MPMNPKAVAAVLKSAKTPKRLKDGLAKKYPAKGRVARQSPFGGFLGQSPSKNNFGKFLSQKQI